MSRCLLMFASSSGEAPV